MSNPTTQHAKKGMTAILVVAGLLLTACTGVTPPAALDTPAQSETAGTSDDTAIGTQPTEPSNAAGSESTVESLTFTVRQSTFLSHIQSAIGQMGPPEHHTYVEFTGADEVTWQGERLIYPEREVLFLQQAASDGSSAVRLELPPNPGEESVTALLPQTGTPTGVQADVDVQFVRATLRDTQDTGTNGGNVWSFDVTVAHPDTGWEDYTDGWHVETLDGVILGTRVLLHPHVNEQPFTRSLGGVQIPSDVSEVRIRTHDLVSGYGPAAVTLPLDRVGSGERYDIVR